MIRYPTFLITNQKAVANGKLTLEYDGRLTPELVLKNFLEYKSILDEITLKGWKYLYIEMTGKYFVELEFSGQPSRIIPYAADWFTKGRFSIDVELGKPFPEVKIKEVDEFHINISTKSFPRSVTVELVKQIITYVENTFWDWMDEWMEDKEKLSKAFEVYEVVRWLMEEKKFKLHENLHEERCRGLLQKFREYESKNEIIEKLKS
ncbi:MAG: hypothetical protein QXO01_03305 [Nitrososphaerota archaeon]|nr:hypothetical protein [Candidatus Bathyarchaeota archaeon]